MDDFCAKCNKQFSRTDSQLVPCNGLCKRLFHRGCCVGQISEYDLKLLKANRNLLYLCQDCVDLPSGISKAIDSMLLSNKLAVELITKSLDAKFNDLSVRLDVMENQISSLHSSNNNMYENNVNSNRNIEILVDEVKALKYAVINSSSSASNMLTAVSPSNLSTAVVPLPNMPAVAVLPSHQLSNAKRASEVSTAISLPSPKLSSVSAVSRPTAAAVLSPSFSEFSPPTSSANVAAHSPNSSPLPVAVTNAVSAIPTSSAYNLRSQKQVSNITNNNITLPAVVRTVSPANCTSPATVTVDVDAIVVPANGVHSPTAPKSNAVNAVIGADAVAHRTPSTAPQSADTRVSKDDVVVAAAVLTDAGTSAAFLNYMASTQCADTHGANASSVDITKWSTVQNKKLSKSKNIVVGRNLSTELEVIDKKKWLHISAFKPTVTVENVVEYIVKHFGIASNYLSCFKLVKKDTPFDSLHKVNFKLGVSCNYYMKLLDANLWPVGINVRPFRFSKKE